MPVAVPVAVAPADGLTAAAAAAQQSVVSHVLQLSLKEEQIIGQLSETNAAIERLEGQLQLVQGELSDCVTARKQVGTAARRWGPAGGRRGASWGRGRQRHRGIGDWEDRGIAGEGKAAATWGIGK